jgi:TetR/AcrR family transcriptional regulator
VARRTPPDPATPTGARRRRYVPGVQRRQQILEAAAALFARRGFAGTSTRQIAEAVGVSETLLFRHFPTKDSLYEAILERLVPSADLARWLGELRRLADKRDDEGLFRGIARAVMRSFREDTTFHRLLLFAALEDHDLARTAHVKYTAPVAAFLREYVSRRQAEGAFRKMRPEAVVHMVLNVPAQFAQWKALGVNPLGLSEQEVAAQMRTVLHGCVAPPTPDSTTRSSRLAGPAEERRGRRP